MTRTENTFTSWTAPTTGTYYITVVAYNRAIDPSDPVCSDGVVIDDTPPTLREIFLDNVRISAGIIKNSNGDVFYVNHQRYRYALPDATDACRYIIINIRIRLFNIFSKVSLPYPHKNR